jgi:hypothetical protein
MGRRYSLDCGSTLKARFHCFGSEMGSGKGKVGIARPEVEKPYANISKQAGVSEQNQIVATTSSINKRRTTLANGWKSQNTLSCKSLARNFVSCKIYRITKSRQAAPRPATRIY